MKPFDPATNLKSEHLELASISGAHDGDCLPRLTHSLNVSLGLAMHRKQFAVNDVSHNSCLDLESS